MYVFKFFLSLIFAINVLVSSSPKLNNESSVKVPHSNGFRFQKGIYLNFQEFINNSPSIDQYQILDKKYKLLISPKTFYIPQFASYYSKTKKRYIRYLNKSDIYDTLLIQEIWGFSDGVNVFKKYQNEFYLLSVNHICMMQFWEHAKLVELDFYSKGYSGESFSDLIPDLGEGKYDFVELSFQINDLINKVKYNSKNNLAMNINNGEVFEISDYINQMKIIIMSDNELYNEMLNDNREDKNQVLVEYFHKYTIRNPILFPVCID